MRRGVAAGTGVGGAEGPAELALLLARVARLGPIVSRSGDNRGGVSPLCNRADSW